MTQKIPFVVIVFVSALVASFQNTSSGVSEDKPLSPEWVSFQESVEKMHSVMMSTKSSNDSDLDFVKLMLPHHQAAIEMAKIQLMYGKDAQIRRLAQEIITDQQSEIELMELWVKQHSINSSNDSYQLDRS